LWLMNTLLESKVHRFNLNTLRLDKELQASKIDLLLLPGEIQKRAVVAAQWHTAMDRQVCFPRNTKIETLTGEKSIQDIAESDLVLSHLGWRKVKQTIKREYSGKMVKIDTSDGKSLIATAEHPIHVEEKGWISIQKLRKTDRLRISASQQCYDQFNPKDKIVHVISKLSILWQALNVYNLEVEAAHTFYANGILVHNCPLCNSLQGEIIPVDSPEWGRVAPPIHLGCRCMLSYITADERGVIQRLEQHKPIDPVLLKHWSSKIYTDAEIREMVKNQVESLIPFHENLTQKEKDLLKYYSGSPHYTSMREYMTSGTIKRNNLRLRWGDKFYNEMKEKSEAMLELFRKYHDGQIDTILHRGLGYLDESVYNRAKAYKVGDTISIDKSMTSWSTDPKIIEDFTKGPHNIKYSLRGGRKTTQELDVWQYSPFPEEKEVLVNTTEFKVVEIKEIIDKEQGTQILNLILEEI